MAQYADDTCLFYQNKFKHLPNSIQDLQHSLDQLCRTNSKIRLGSPTGTPRKLKLTDPKGVVTTCESYTKQVDRDEQVTQSTPSTIIMVHTQNTDRDENDTQPSRSFASNLDLPPSSSSSLASHPTPPSKLPPIAPEPSVAGGQEPGTNIATTQPLPQRRQAKYTVAGKYRAVEGTKRPKNQRPLALPLEPPKNRQLDKDKDCFPTPRMTHTFD